MNVLILAAGGPVQDGREPYPIWLSEIDGQLLLERQIRFLERLEPNRFVVCVQAEDDMKYHVKDILAMISPKAIMVDIKRPTAGAACTALLAINKIRFDEELVIVNSTDQIEVDFIEVVEHFRSSGADGGILTFDSLHPRYSFVRLDESGHVVEVAEKRPISRDANAGFYWLRNAGEFFTALQEMILKDAHVNGRYYVAPALNELILRQKVIQAIRLPKGAYIPVKSSKQLDQFEQATEVGAVL